MLKNLSFIIAVIGGFSLAALSSAPVQAGAVHLSVRLSAPIVETDVVQVSHRWCHHRWNSGWSGCDRPPGWSSPGKRKGWKGGDVPPGWQKN